MTKTQLKSEIQKVLDGVPYAILKDVLDFPKRLQESLTAKVKLKNNLRQILIEDKNLLERLAK